MLAWWHQPPAPTAGAETAPWRRRLLRDLPGTVLRQRCSLRAPRGRALLTATALAAVPRVRGRKAPPETKDPAFCWLSDSLDGYWGSSARVLDAGTGPDSLIWLASRPVAAITAVTA
eukprot:TRINITY_DN69739_c0_g1_i1.p1 TRINITY_DN69739_c0_g1~~TRINITY_DN69739_c0_g1_i1.p1  ORF type:complete len:117 (-),score=15.41 TRINITY_DN69739_c0_g1_i1:4-354(-)